MKHLGLLAVACLAVVMSAQVAWARGTGVVACDRFGCSDWQQAAPAKKAVHVARKAAKRGQARRPALDANGSPARPITVPTMVGIEITVAPGFVRPIQGLIADLKLRGVQPRKIHCLARSGHRPGSLHYRGEACDFDFYAPCMGCSARWTRTIADLTSKWGLRNGCSFGDCGHVDSGRIGVARAPWPRVLMAQP